MFHKFKLKVFLSPFTPLHKLSPKAVRGTPQNHTPLIPAPFLPSPFAHCSSLWDKHRVKRGVELLPPSVGQRAASYLTDRMVCKVSKTGFSEVTDPNKFFIVCKKSRIENNTSFYGCFYLGPFDESLSQTLANDLRRTLLSELIGLAITSVEIEGVLHKFSSLPGLKEPVLDFICNLQTVVLKKSGGPIKPLPASRPSLRSGKDKLEAKTEKPILRLSPDTKGRGTKKTYTGFLKVRGPRVIKARDLKLPAGILCVDPNQYIATLAEDGILNMKFHINQGKSYVFQKPQNFDVTNLKKRNIMLHKTKKYKSLLNSNLVSSQTLEFMKDPNKKTVFLTTQKDNSNTVLPKKELGENLPAVSSVSFPLQPITLDAVFMPVTKVNCIIDDNNLATDFNIFKNVQASVPELLSMRLPGLSSQENHLKKGAISEHVDTNSLFTYPFITEGTEGEGVRSFTPSYPNFIPAGDLAKGDGGSGDLVKSGSGLEGAFHSFLLSPQGGLAHRGHFPTLDFITNADVQAQRQTSLFFNNAFCLYKNNLKLNKLYSQIKQQTKLKLIPWYENLSYFNFGNVSVSSANKPNPPSNPFYSKSKGVSPSLRSNPSFYPNYSEGGVSKDKLEVKTEKGLAKGDNLTQQIKRRGTYSPSNIKLLSAKGKAFSFNKINRVKPLLGSYNFYNYNLSQIHHAKPLTVISNNAQAKQEFNLPIVAKKLLYPEKYSILPPVLAVPERVCFVRRGRLVSSVNKPNPPSNPFALPVKRVSPSLRSPALLITPRGLGKEGKDKLEVKTEGGIMVRGFAPSNNADREPAFPLPSYTRIPLNYPLFFPVFTSSLREERSERIPLRPSLRLGKKGKRGLAKASSFYLDLSSPSKVPLHSVSCYPTFGGIRKAPYPLLPKFIPYPVGGKGFSEGQSPLPKEGLGALSAVVSAKVHKKNSRTEYVLGEKASDKASLTSALGDLSYLRGISKGDKVYSRRFAGKVYSYQDLLNIEYSKILKLKPLIKKCHLILEIWTNGSIHPRQALYNSFSFLTNTFLKLQKVKPLGSMFRSELAYGNINKYYTCPTNPFPFGTLLSLLTPFGGYSGKNGYKGVSNNLEIGRGEYSKQIVQKRGRESQELPIGVLPISLRAYTALRKAEIFTLNHLLNYSKGELLKLKNFGPKSLFEVEKTLADLGLSLYP